MFYNISDNRKVKSEVKDAWSEWLGRYSWDWWTTLTFRNTITTRTADHLWCKWIRAIENELNDQVGYFRVSEVQRAREMLHFHALMLNTKRLRRLTWMDRWNDIAGYARIFPYDPTLGAKVYLTKYISKELADYKVGGRILRT